MPVPEKPAIAPSSKLDGSSSAAPLVIAGTEVPPGTRRHVDVPVGQNYTPGRIILPAIVVNGREPGPVLFVSAAIHGDEINGVEIIRRLLRSAALRRLRGALIAVPIVNVYGFANQSRYLPDRRDLNRSFPGSPTGSLAARLADTFMSEIVARATHGIDLHTAAGHRTNLPQVRACLDQPDTERLARAFGAPVILNADIRDGSLRQAVLDCKVPMLLYEAGEVLRFDELSIRAGVRGILSVMRALKMLRPVRQSKKPLRPVIARSSQWVRAPRAGLLHLAARLGSRVREGQTLAHITDPLGGEDVKVIAPAAGLTIAKTLLPLVNEGDALFHIALFDEPGKAERRVEAFQAEFDPGPVPTV